MIVIVGGGISGLSAAFELTQRNVPFRLLEASPRAGGLIATEQRDGFTIDAGADSMLGAKPAARDLCAQVGLAPQLQEMKAPRSAFMLAGDRLFALPVPSVLGVPTTIGAAARFRLLPLPSRARVLLEPFVARGPSDDESIASFFTRRFGAAAARLVAQPLLGGIHAGDTRELSVRALFPNLVQAEAAGSVLRGLARRSPAPGGAFLALAGGMETLPRALARALPAGSIRYDAEVRRVTREVPGWRVETDGGQERAMAVLFASPAHVTARLLATVDAEAAAICRGIAHASSVTVTLAWPRDAVPHPLAGSGFVVVPGGGYRITACTWSSSKWEGRAPAGHALLRAFVGGTADAGAIELPDDELAAIARRDLGRAIGVAAAPELTVVRRWRDASPQLTVGHEARTERIAEQLRRCPGVFLTGRGIRAVGIPDCIADARAAAAAAADYVSRSES
jgi:oxygen-dependent protoporphyrinogen oxidase